MRRPETRDQVVARMDQVHSAATAATEKVNQEIKSVKEASDQHWASLEAKVAAGRCSRSSRST
jgi:hypothetical protein